ncbi:MAG: pyridoxamine 5'-phosphate oxidase family protein [Acidimicrobiales bacterium]|nr:pyridoxamine 5'-phosphate oxidase family protein [Acidimicrobiales bacterium]
MTDTAVTPGGIVLTDEMAQAVNRALESGKPITVAYVDADGQPHLSFRGSTQTYAPDQLAIWVRDPEGGILKALERNPRLTLLYRDPETRTTLMFYGRGRVETSEEAHRTVYDHSPEAERQRDPERKGKPVVIELDRVEGITPAGRVRMSRD